MWYKASFVRKTAYGPIPLFTVVLYNVHITQLAQYQYQSILYGVQNLPENQSKYLGS